MANLHSIRTKGSAFVAVFRPLDKVHPDFHWTNILATDFREFHWWSQKYDKLIASFTDANSLAMATSKVPCMVLQNG